MTQPLSEVINTNTSPPRLGVITERAKGSIAIQWRDGREQRVSSLGGKLIEVVEGGLAEMLSQGDVTTDHLIETTPLVAAVGALRDAGKPLRLAGLKAQLEKYGASERTLEHKWPIIKTQLREQPHVRHERGVYTWVERAETEKAVGPSASAKTERDLSASTVTDALRRLTSNEGSIPDPSTWTPEESFIAWAIGAGPRPVNPDEFIVHLKEPVRKRLLQESELVPELRTALLDASTKSSSATEALRRLDSDAWNLYVATLRERVPQIDARTAPSRDQLGLALVEPLKRISETLPPTVQPRTLTTLLQLALELGPTSKPAQEIERLTCLDQLRPLLPEAVAAMDDTDLARVSAWPWLPTGLRMRVCEAMAPGVASRLLAGETTWRGFTVDMLEALEASNSPLFDRLGELGAPIETILLKTVELGGTPMLRMLAWPPRLRSLLPVAPYQAALSRARERDASLALLLEDPASRTLRSDLTQRSKEVSRLQDELHVALSDLAQARERLGRLEGAVRQHTTSSQGAHKAQLRQAAIDGTRLAADVLARVFEACEATASGDLVPWQEALTVARDFGLHPIGAPGARVSSDEAIGPKFDWLGQRKGVAIVVRPGYEWVLDSETVVLRRAVVMGEGALHGEATRGRGHRLRNLDDSGH